MKAIALPSTLVGLRAAISAGELSPELALQQQMERLSLDEHVHALTHRFAVRTPPEISLPLGGVGLAHKDIFIMQGRLPQCGTHIDDFTESQIERWHAQSANQGDSPVVRALEAAGSTTLAAVTMAEFASGVTGENPNLPLPVNPLDPDAAVGGSSSGSAVAVAAGLCYGSLGTDTAGSVRIPAATCGIVGLLPTRGVLSSKACFPLAPGLDTVGVLARSALDAAQLLANCLQPDEVQHRLPGLRLTDSASLSGQQGTKTVYNSLKLATAPRLALALEHPDQRFNPISEQATLLEAHAREWARGGSFSSVKLGMQPELTRSANVMMHVEAATTHMAAMQADRLGPIPQGVALPGAALPATWYAQCLEQRARLQRAFCDEYLTDADILLTPALPHGVPNWAEVLTNSQTFNPFALLALFSWTSFVNYLALPAVVFPIGQDARGRPVCVQAIGRPHSEHLLLAFAYSHERNAWGTEGFIPAAMSSVSFTPKHQAVSLHDVVPETSGA